MEVLNWSWTRLVLDGPPAEGFLALFALIFLGIPIIFVALFAIGLEYLSARRGIAIIAVVLVLWVITVAIIRIAV